jgi:hypothetical protein
MDTAELKSLIAKAKREEIFFAVGRGKAPDESVLVLDRRKKPEVLFKVLRLENKAIKKGAWGTLVMDGSVAEFTPEKPLSGLVKDLKAIFKREKISIKVAVVGEEDDEDASGGAQAADDQDRGADRDEAPEDEIEESGGTGARGGQAAPWKPDPKELADYQRAQRGWTVTRERVGADLQKLRQAILAEYADDPELSGIAASVRGLDRVMDALDERLVDALDALASAKTQEAAEEAQERARDIVRRYARFIRQDPLIPRLDENPFVPVSIEKSMTNALDHLVEILA